MTGRFIAFEGGEGTGKSTQAALLVTRLREAGLDVVATREPGGTPEAEAIRSLLLGGAGLAWTPMTEALLVNAARAEHVERLIRPALAAGKWVVSDRYVASTFAYQGAGHGVAAASLRKLHEIACGGLMPDRVLLLDAPLPEALARARARGDGNRFEDEDLDFHDRVRLGFWSLAEAAPETYRLIETTGDVEATAARVWAEVARVGPVMGQG